MIQLEQSLMEEKKRNKQLVEERDQLPIDQQREEDQKKQKEKKEKFKLKTVKPNKNSTGEHLPFQGTSRKETANFGENLNREERNGFNLETVEELQENSQTDGLGEHNEDELRGPIQQEEEKCEIPKLEENNKQCITHEEEEKGDDREESSQPIQLKQINEKDNLKNGDEKQNNIEDEQPNEEKEEKSDTPDPNDNNGNEFKSDDSKGLAVKIKHEIKETDHEEYQRQQANKMFSFNENGIPIWEESTVFPEEQMPECPINFDPVKWEKDCLMSYNKYKLKKFHLLFKKCTQKHEKREAKRKEKEKKEKEAARQLTLKMEQEGKNQIENILEEQYKFLEIDISDMSDTDEEDEQNGPELEPETLDDEKEGKEGKKPKVNKETVTHNKCESSPLPKTPRPNEYGKGSKRYEEPQRKKLRSDKSVSIPKPDLSNVKQELLSQYLKNEEEDESDVDKIHYGREIEDTASEASAVSTPSTRQSERTLTRSNSKRPRDLSASTVKVLSDPNVLSALIDFQTPGDTVEESMRILSSPRVTRAIKQFAADLLPRGGGGDGNMIYPRQDGNYKTEKYNPEIAKNIKREGVTPKSAKRKITESEGFYTMWDSTPIPSPPAQKKQKKEKADKPKDVIQSLGSPTRGGKICTRDASTEYLLRIADVKIEHARKCDSILAKPKGGKKTPECFR